MSARLLLLIAFIIAAPLVLSFAVNGGAVHP